MFEKFTEDETVVWEPVPFETRLEVLPPLAG